MKTSSQDEDGNSEFLEIKSALDKAKKEYNKFNTEIFVNLECNYKQRLNFGEFVVSFHTKRTK